MALKPVDVRVFDRMVRRAHDWARGRVDSVDRFAWLPVRCPATRRWFWLRRVTVTRRARIRLQCLSWGIAIIPVTEWRTILIERVARRR